MWPSESAAAGQAHDCVKLSAMEYRYAFGPGLASHRQRLAGVKDMYSFQSWHFRLPSCHYPTASIFHIMGPRTMPALLETQPDSGSPPLATPCPPRQHVLETTVARLTPAPAQSPLPTISTTHEDELVHWPYSQLCLLACTRRVWRVSGDGEGQRCCVSVA